MRKTLEFILRKLNIRADKNQRIILLWVFVFGLIGTYLYPTITKEVVSKLPAQFIAAEALITSLSGLLVGIIWKGKIRRKAIDYFILLIASESIGAFLLSMWLTFISYNVWVFAIANLLYSCLITVFVGKCLMAFRTKLWPESEREIYDNNNSIVGGITCVLGFGLSLLFLPSVKASIFVWGCCCLFDNIGWGIVYWKNKEMLKSIDDYE